jgi:hypothetical protein
MLAAFYGPVHRVEPGVADDLMLYDPAGIFSEGAEAGDHSGFLTLGQGE